MSDPKRPINYTGTPFHPILEPGEDWRDTLSEFFPTASLDDHLLQFLCPNVLVAGTVEETIVGEEAQDAVEQFSKSMHDALEAYKKIPLQVRSGKNDELPRILQRAEYLLTGKDPETGYYEADPARPWPEGNRELDRMVKAASDLPSVSPKAEQHRAREKARLVEVGRRLWHYLKGHGKYDDPADTIRAPRHAAEHQPFYWFIKVLIRWAGKDWSVERTMKAWRSVNPK